MQRGLKMHNEHVREWLRYRVKLYVRVIQLREAYKKAMVEYAREIPAKNKRANIIPFKSKNNTCKSV
jgi:hypothetical protein